MDPTSVLWSIDKGANSLSTFENVEFFAVNVLASDQVIPSPLSYFPLSEN